MWIFDTKIGFFSAVADGQQPGNVLVRFRDPAHGRAFCDAVHALPGWRGRRPKLRETPSPADYRWKVSVAAEWYTAIVVKAAEAVTGYQNFKGECSKMASPAHVRAMHGNHHEVWAVMNRHQLGVIERRRRKERLKAHPVESFDERELFDDKPRRTLFPRGTRFDHVPHDYDGDSLEARAIRGEP